MQGLLDGRIALITGAGSGIGEGIAHAMAQAGAHVLILDRDGTAAQRTAAAIGGDASAYTLDVTDRDACDGLAASIRRDVGAISVLVNNAGILRRGRIEDADARADWDATMAVNLDGVFNVTTAFRAHLVETKGAVINIGSVQSFVALPNSAAYTASKGGVRALTKALAIELSPLGVRVNAIGPGLIATPLNATARQNPDYMRNFQNRIPLGRIGETADVAGPAVFLASDMARYITGVTLPVDGGFLAY
ncbi:MAG TPA: glucose 1-dehydrogenase [Acetobacteraceae bacterium]|nr:glucose 1-dehydrogenase [Acetobacteraceae bacterium]